MLLLVGVTIILSCALNIHVVVGWCYHYNNWSSSRENLSSGFPTKQLKNQSLQLQRLAKNLKFYP